MNRPFHAIGVLLAFLALAMLAVGSASRPRAKTTARVQPSAVQQVEAVPALTPRGGIYVLVLPAGDDRVAEFLVPCDLPTFALGCGLDRTTGVTYPQPVVEAVVEAEAKTVAFVPVTICAAVEPNLPMSAIEEDCMAHHDALYDELVHGWCHEAKSEAPAAATSQEFSESLNDADCLALILDLMG